MSNHSILVKIWKLNNRNKEEMVDVKRCSFDRFALNEFIDKYGAINLKPHKMETGKFYHTKE